MCDIGDDWVSYWQAQVKALDEKDSGCSCEPLLAGPGSTHPLAPLADGGEAKGGGEVGLLTGREALHEVYVLLVGECLGAAARTASFGEAHIPACVAC